MKLKNFCFLFYVISLISCGSPKKIDLTSEPFNFSTYKATIEQAYADSPNKQSQELLLNFINDNIQGKIDKNSMYSFIETNGALKGVGIPTYGYILSSLAKPYSDWKKNMNEFNTKLAGTLEMKLIDILKDYSGEKNTPKFEIKNIGDIDIVSLEFSLSMTNNSGEELFFGNFEYSQKVGKGTTKTFKHEYVSDIVKVANMDLSLITKNITVTKVSFIDGTTLIRPEEYVN
jgi:hypothetical protein